MVRSPDSKRGRLRDGDAGFGCSCWRWQPAPAGAADAAAPRWRQRPRSKPLGKRGRRGSSARRRKRRPCASSGRPSAQTRRRSEARRKRARNPERQGVAGREGGGAGGTRVSPARRRFRVADRRLPRCQAVGRSASVRRGGLPRRTPPGRRGGRAAADGPAEAGRSRPGRRGRRFHAEPLGPRPAREVPGRGRNRSSGRSKSRRSLLHSERTGRRLPVRHWGNWSGARSRLTTPRRHARLPCRHSLPIPIAMPRPFCFRS